MQAFFIVLVGVIVFLAIAFCKSPEFDSEVKFAVGILATILSTILITVVSIQQHTFRKKPEFSTQINVNRR